MRHLIKYTKSAALAAVVGLAAASCADFLEIEPRDIVTEDNFWNEKTDIDQSVAGCYASMQAEDFINRCIVWGEVRSDNLYPADQLENNHYDLYQTLRENLLSTNQFTSWACFYSIINKCNIIIRMAPVVSEKDPSYRESDVKATIAEMTALRSLCYFYLIRTFKDVPFSREPVQQEDETLALPASKFDEVLANIIADLEAVKGDAIARYPVTSEDCIGGRYNSNCNRINRSGINAILCDMYLWSGEWDKAIACAEEILAQKRTDYKEFYGNVANASSLTSAPRLLTSGETTVPLYENTANSASVSFNAIFAKGNSFESIFELSFNSTGKDDAQYVKNSSIGRFYGWGGTKDDKVSPEVPENNGTGLLVVNPDIASGVYKKHWDEYWKHEQDTRFYNSINGVTNTYDEGRIRKLMASEYNVRGTAGNFNNFGSGSGSAFTLATRLDRNWIFYRLTDVMLMEAEALLQKATDETSEENTALRKKAFELLFLVSDRSCMDKSKSLTNKFKSLTEMREYLQKERNRELMFEGKRFFDLVRYARREGSANLVKETVKSKIGGSQNGGFPSYEHLFWPYNKKELEVNPQLQQKAIYGSEGSDDIKMNK